MNSNRKTIYSTNQPKEILGYKIKGQWCGMVTAWKNGIYVRHYIDSAKNDELHGPNITFNYR